MSSSTIITTCGLLLNFVVAPANDGAIIPPERLEAEQRARRLVTLANEGRDLDLIAQALADLTRELARHPSEPPLLIATIQPGCIEVSNQPFPSSKAKEGSN